MRCYYTSSYIITPSPLTEVTQMSPLILLTHIEGSSVQMLEQKCTPKFPRIICQKNWCRYQIFDLWIIPKALTLPDFCFCFVTTDYLLNFLHALYPCSEITKQKHRFRSCSFHAQTILFILRQTNTEIAVLNYSAVCLFLPSN